jgi:hypothetical protein
MIRLHPTPDAPFTCPRDGAQLDVLGWHMPGMWTVADLRCRQCGVEFWGDLPAGWGLYHPCLVDKRTREVYDPGHSTWWANLHRRVAPVDVPVGLEVEQFRPVRRPVVLNCLDWLYGHCVLKLINAQYYIDRKPDFDLIVIVPKLLRWMVPDGAAEVWTVDVPLRRGSEWNEWLGREFRRRLEPFPEAWLSLAFSHPHPSTFDIERYTGVAPFDEARWVTSQTAPVVTFIWRDDRTWPDVEGFSGPAWFVGKVMRRFGPTRRLLRTVLVRWQRARFLAVARRLRRAYPGADIGFVGVAEPGGLPGWLRDLRTTRLNPDQERAWCRRYADSHLVIGVHGSNLQLPAALAGSVLELVPTDRERVMFTTMLPPTPDSREALYRYRFVPLSLGARDVGRIAESILWYQPVADIWFSRRWTDHETVAADPLSVRGQWQAIFALPSTGDRGGLTGAIAPTAAVLGQEPAGSARPG